MLFDHLSAYTGKVHHSESAFTNSPTWFSIECNAGCLSRYNCILSWLGRHRETQTQQKKSVYWKCNAHVLL